ncbi:hypothetical protein THASP1DRAFT_11062, partial [Thamnocephalis sphaerospora]
AARPYQCHYEGCDKAYKKPCKLEEHIRSHTNERPYVCPFPDCGKSYLRNTHLQAHARTHDPSSARAFVCNHDGCDRGFATSQRLRRHQLTHTVPRPYKCTTEGCDQAFAKHTQLRKHMSEHTGLRPYPCEEDGCSCSFQTPSALRKHMLTHTSKSRAYERIYMCGRDECGQQFTKWSLLQAHVQEMHRYRCVECGREFKKGDALRAHMRTHDENAPVFHCPFEGCTKHYAKENGLQTHIRIIHNNEKRFECNVCGKRFGYKHVMLAHLIHIRCELTLLLHTVTHRQQVLESVGGVQKRKRSRSSPSDAVDMITGSSYAQDPKRRFACLVPGCLHRFTRFYDLDRHRKSMH